jgi:endonuclease/exonuclease/phosphatase (EEP) superfamily protein YafD
VTVAAEFVGSAGCVSCHQPQAAGWQQSQHARAMQHATADTVLGDFNDGPTSATHRRLRELGSDTFIQSGAGWGSTYRGLRVVPLRIDWIWTSGDWKALEHRVVKQRWSDHNPVVARVTRN